jgi:hypothetical protein
VENDVTYSETLVVLSSGNIAEAFVGQTLKPQKSRINHEACHDMV